MESHKIHVPFTTNQISTNDSTCSTWTEPCGLVGGDIIWMMFNLTERYRCCMDWEVTISFGWKVRCPRRAVLPNLWSFGDVAGLLTLRQSNMVTGRHGNWWKCLLAETWWMLLREFIDVDIRWFHHRYKNRNGGSSWILYISPPAISFMVCWKLPSSSIENPSKLYLHGLLFGEFPACHVWVPEASHHSLIIRDGNYTHLSISIHSSWWW